MENSEVASGGDVCETERAAAGGVQLVFKPPMSIRRYNFVAETIAARPGIQAVVDFGCAGGQLVTRLSAGLEQLEWIVGVDIDESILKANATRIQPPTFLYSVAGGRSRPLYIALFQGSLTDYDQRMTRASAVTLVEVIEHLENDVLEGAVVNVFGRLAPELVIVTTPNAEFNVLIPGFHGMRHCDHKFEWTRFEFQNWCRGICEKYSYDMSTHEIGEDPLKRDVPVGCCTQAAIFTRRRDVLPSVGIQKCDRSSERVTNAEIVGCHPGDPASSAAAAEVHSKVLCNGCLRKVEGYPEEAALDHEHHKFACGEQKHDCGEGCSGSHGTYSLIAEYFVPARQQQSPTSELANELQYQLRHISQSRKEEQCFTYDDQFIPPCYFCANSSSPPESLTSDDDDDNGDLVESNNWPEPEETEPPFQFTTVQREWCDCAVDAASANCPSSDHASAPLLEEHHGHVEATTSDDEPSGRVPESILVRTAASPSWLERELVQGDYGLRSAVIITDSEHSTAVMSEDGDLSSTSVAGGVLLGSLEGSGDAFANATVGDIAAAGSASSEVSMPGKGDDDILCLRWPLLSKAADACSKDADLINDDTEECSRCPVHIAIRCLMQCYRVHELCDGQPTRLVEALRRIGYGLVSRQRVVVYRQHRSHLGC